MAISPNKWYYVQHTSPISTPSDVVKNRSSIIKNIRALYPSSTALQYWHDELTNSTEESTRDKYEENFAEFLEFNGKSPDELIVQRQHDLLSKDIKIQRTIESQFLGFIKLKKKQGYAIATQQIIYASIRSFFEIHYFPLRMRRGDYPKGGSDGVKRATKEAIQNILNQTTRNQVTINAMALSLKDCGLRVSDARRLNCDIILEAIEKNLDLIQISIITQKTKLLAKTFLGKEAIEALKIYIETRKKGSRNVEPETITKDSPLFRTWENGKVKRIPRGSMSSLIRGAFLRANEKKMSAHSLRKKLQTDLEKAGINSNWIDQILGHQLINSRDAYSLPTDEELREAYTKAYHYIKVCPETSGIKKIFVQPEVDKTSQVPTSENQLFTVKTATTLEQAINLIAQGYQFADAVEGIRIYKKNN